MEAIAFRKFNEEFFTKRADRIAEIYRHIETISFSGFDIKITGPDYGWLDIHMYLDGKEAFLFEPSDIYPPFPDLRDWLNDMLRFYDVHYKSSELYPILHEHFGKSMNLARIKALSMMVCALCKVQRVTYTKLAAAFDSEAAAGSSLRRIQRLIAECEIRTDLIAKLILKLIPVQGPYNLTLDRTNWKFSDTNINILALGIIYDGMAFPIVFKMMDKRGNSNT